MSSAFRFLRTRAASAASAGALIQEEWPVQPAGAASLSFSSSPGVSGPPPPGEAAARPWTRGGTRNMALDVRYVLDSLGEPLLALDRSARILHANTAFKQLLG